MAHITVYLPISVLEHINEIAKNTGASRNQALVALLMSADRALAESILEYYAEVKKEIEKTAERVDPVNVFARVKSLEIPREIREDPEFSKALQRAKKVLKNGQTLNGVLRWLLPEIEEIALKHGYTIRQKQLLKAYLVQVLRGAPP